MPTFEVDIGDATYQVDAPDENTAYQYATSEHEAGGSQQPVEDAGLLARISESITGKARSTPEIEALPDWRGNMPEFSLSQGIPALKTAFGTVFTDPDETAKIIKSNFPDIQVKQDSKGNYIFKSAIDEKEYALKPGFRGSDIPRAIAGTLLSLPAARATSVLGAAGAAGLTQAGIEATQAATGGEFNASEIPTAAAFGGATQAAFKILGTAIPGAKRLFQGKSFIPEDIAASVPEVAPEVAAKDLRSIVDKATGSGLGATKAQMELAQLARVNPEALAIAQELGIEVPIDVLSDNPQMKAIVGTSRGIAGSEAEAGWKTQQAQFVQQADDLMDRIGANNSLSEVSDDVKAALKKTRDDLASSAKKSYDEIKQLILEKTVVSSKEDPGLPNLKKLLDDTLEKVGSIERFRPQEAELYDIVNKKKMTYGDFNRIKDDIRSALYKKTPNTYGNLNSSILSDLYNALTLDQLAAVEKFAGVEAKNNLLAANATYAKKANLERLIVDAFGKDTEGSIAGLIRQSITKTGKGSSEGLTKLLKVVPQDLQKDTLLTAISDLATETRAEFGGQFSFSKFRALYDGIQKERPLMSQIEGVIGPDAARALKGLNEVSKRVTEARALVSSTGKANQALIQELRAQTLTDRILNPATGAAIGASIGGAPGAWAGSKLFSAIGGSKDRIAATGKLFMSPEFQKLASDAASKSTVPNSSISAVARSSAFKKYAALMKLPYEPSKAERWLKAALMSPYDMAQPQSAFEPSRVVAEILPNASIKSDPATKFKILQKPGGNYRLLAPDGTISVFATETEAIKAANKQLKRLNAAPVK
jgi:hypothetical protein